MNLLTALALLWPLPLLAATTPILDSYRAAAAQEAPGFKDFSAAHGETFYGAKVGELSCSTCHSASPRNHGKHSTTGKDILPMATVANPQRFTDAAKVEKWFKRNCNDVLKRACTANEKGDFIAYLQSIK
jgi:hypothetical protein